MESTDLKNLNSNFISSISDASRGKGFRAFLNSSVGKGYLNNDKKKKRSGALYMSKLKK